MGLKMDAQEIVKLLKDQEVVIEFRHYRTDELLKVKATLDPSVTGSTIVDHNPQSEVVAFWDVDAKDWKSVAVNTIVGVEWNY